MRGMDMSIGEKRGTSPHCVVALPLALALLSRQILVSHGDVERATISF